MVIKKVGTSLPTPAADASAEVGKASGKGFAATTAQRASGASQGVSSVGNAALVERAVTDVAADIRSGKPLDEQARVDAVIERMVTMQSGEGMPPAQLRERVDDAQLALGDHPAFAGQVTAMLNKVLATPDA